MSDVPEYMTVISPLLSNKIDEIYNMISSNLEDVQNSLKCLSEKIDGLEKKVKIIENKKTELNFISRDYWTTSD